MKKVDKLLSDLGHAARRASPPDVDVHSKVLKTIARQQVVNRAAKLDFVPLAFGGVAIAVAAMVCFVCFPSFQMLSDPWASYFTP